MKMKRLLAISLIIILTFGLSTSGLLAQPTADYEEDKLLASDGAADDRFGNSVAISGDTIVVGAEYDDDYGPGSGSAYVFSYDGTEWSQQDKLLASDGDIHDRFGYSVDISGDIIVVGAPADDNENGAQAGAAYVFMRTGSNWHQQQKLRASDGEAGDFFGTSVSINGGFIVVGAKYDDDNGNNSGSAYVFVRDINNWMEVQKLLASDGGEDDLFGISVTNTIDTIVVGAEGDDDNGSNAGAAYVFARNGTDWTEEDKLLAGDGAVGDLFGRSAAISGDTVVVGAENDNDNGVNSGSAYVFSYDGTEWSQQDKLLASDGAEADWFGCSVAISGGTIVIGSVGDDDNGELSGSAYAFSYNGTDWAEQQKLLASDGAAFDVFGSSIAISGDIIVVGAEADDDNGEDSGSAYVFTSLLSPPPGCGKP